MRLLTWVALGVPDLLTPGTRVSLGTQALEAVLHVRRHAAPPVGTGAVLAGVVLGHAHKLHGLTPQVQRHALNLHLTDTAYNTTITALMCSWRD